MFFGRFHSVWPFLSFLTERTNKIPVKMQEWRRAGQSQRNQRFSNSFAQHNATGCKKYMDDDRPGHRLGAERGLSPGPGPRGFPSALPTRRRCTLAAGRSLDGRVARVRTQRGAQLRRPRRGVRGRRGRPAGRRRGCEGPGSGAQAIGLDTATGCHHDPHPGSASRV